MFNYNKYLNMFYRILAGNFLVIPLHATLLFHLENDSVALFDNFFKLLILKFAKIKLKFAKFKLKLCKFGKKMAYKW